MDLSELDPHVVQLFPSHALAIAKNKILEMGTITVEACENVREYFISKSSTAKETVEELENAINLLDKKISEYLLLISHEQLNDHDSKEYFADMKSIKDLERVGDLCINLTQFFEAVYDEKDDFSSEAKDDIIAMINMDIEMLNHAMVAFDKHDLDDIIYVDDHEMGTVPGVSRVRGVRTFCHQFEENEQYQIIDISHNGYVYREDPIYHRRKVIHMAEDIYVIDDQVTGMGLREHDIRLYFNFAFGELEQKEHGLFQYISQRGCHYEVINMGSKELEYEILKGSEEPIGGWVSYGYGWRKPIPQLAVKSTGPVPIHFLTVLKPEGVFVDIQMQQEKTVIRKEDGTGIIITENAVKTIEEDNQ